MIKQLNRRGDNGFALLMTLLVVGVIITVGLTILDVTIKQVRLSANSKDSEMAFHAASGGLECAQYWRRTQASAMESGGDNLTLTCFTSAPATKIESTLTDIDSQDVTVSGTGAAAHRYSYQITWGSGVEAKCSQIDTVVIVSAPTVAGVVSSANLLAIIPGYPGTAGKTCPAGGVCTILSARGFSRGCPTVSGGVFPPGTIQREVLLEY